MLTAILGHGRDHIKARRDENVVLEHSEFVAAVAAHDELRNDLLPAMSGDESEHRELLGDRSREAGVGLRDPPLNVDVLSWTFHGPSS